MFEKIEVPRNATNKWEITTTGLPVETKADRQKRRLDKWMEKYRKSQSLGKHTGVNQ